MIAFHPWGTVMSSHARFAIVLTGAFLAVAAMLLLRHEMWTDELNPWLYNTHSPSLSAMFRMASGEDQPRLWYLVLYPLSRVTHSPLSMQWLHWLIAGAVVYVFAAYAPFAKGQKILFAFGRLALFEFGTLVRCYSMGILLLFIFCSLLPARRSGFFWLCVILALLANANVDGLILAAAMGLALALDQIGRLRGAHLRAWTTIAGFYALFVGCVIAVTQCFPGREPGTSMSGAFQFYLSRVFYPRNFLKGAVTIADGFIPFTNAYSRLLPFDGLPDILRIAVVSFIMLWGSLLFLRTRIAFFFWLFSTMGIALFFTICPWPGHLRHFGHYYMVFIAAMWIMRREDARPVYSIPFGRLADFVRSSADPILYALLVVQIICGVDPIYADWRLPFSGARAAARYIQETGREDWLLAACRILPASSIEAYLDRDVYALPYNRIFGVPMATKIDEGDGDENLRKAALAEIPGLHARYGSKVLFIFNYWPLKESLIQQYGLFEAARSDNALLEHEKFFLYTFDSAAKSGPIREATK